jgi:hypothetical protein
VLGCILAAVTAVEELIAACAADASGPSITERLEEFFRRSSAGPAVPTAAVAAAAPTPPLAPRFDVSGVTLRATRDRDAGPAASFSSPAGAAGRSSKPADPLMEQLKQRNDAQMSERVTQRHDHIVECFRRLTEPLPVSSVEDTEAALSDAVERECVTPPQSLSLSLCVCVCVQLLRFVRAHG